MSELKDTEISKAIISTCHDKLLNRIAGCVLIIADGPPGLMVAIYVGQLFPEVQLRPLAVQ